MTREVKNHIESIRKRDGRIVPFESGRIVDAIYKAAVSVGGKDKEMSKKVAKEVIARLNKRYGPKDIPSVEEIQDTVEKTLMDMGHSKTAKSYILYRDLHNRIRNIKSLVDADELINSYVDVKDWRVKENSNMSFSWTGLNYHISSSIQANYWLFSVYPFE